MLSHLWSIGWLNVVLRDGSIDGVLGKMEGGRYEAYPDTTIEQQLDQLQGSPLKE